MTNTSRKLNLGCGGQIAHGWLNVDRSFGALMMERATAEWAELDLREPWPWADESMDFAVAHHLLDLLEAPDLMHVLKEAFRVLMPGGVLRISSVDHARAFEALAGHDAEWFARKGVPAELCDDARLAFDWWLDWGGARRTLLPLAGTRRLLETLGFTVAEVDYDVTTTLPAICELDSRADESWFLEARKP